MALGPPKIMRSIRLGFLAFPHHGKHFLDVLLQIVVAEHGCLSLMSPAGGGSPDGERFITCRWCASPSFPKHLLRKCLHLDFTYWPV